MTIIARRVVASPARSASDVWKLIVSLLLPQSGTESYKELMGLIGVASSLISSEVLRSAPIIIYGSGPRVRIYCLYGEDAITGNNANEGSLPFSPLEGDWKISLPCSEDDLSWVQQAIAKRSKRVTARDMTTAVEEQAKSAENFAVVDIEAFLRP